MNTDIEAQRALDHWKHGGFDALPGNEKVLLAAWLFDAKLENGGFANWFQSEAGDLACEAPGALERIGALQLAEIARNANGLFGKEGPPRERPARRARMHDLGAAAEERMNALSAQYYESSEDVDDLLDRFLNREAATRC